MQECNICSHVSLKVSISLSHVRVQVRDDPMCVWVKTKYKFGLFNFDAYIFWYGYICLSFLTLYMFVYCVSIKLFGNSKRTEKEMVFMLYFITCIQKKSFSRQQIKRDLTFWSSTYVLLFPSRLCHLQSFFWRKGLHILCLLKVKKKRKIITKSQTFEVWNTRSRCGTSGTSKREWWLLFCTMWCLAFWCLEFAKVWENMPYFHIAPLKKYSLCTFPNTGWALIFLYSCLDQRLLQATSCKFI